MLTGGKDEATRRASTQAGLAWVGGRQSRGDVIELWEREPTLGRGGQVGGSITYALVIQRRVTSLRAILEATKPEGIGGAKILFLYKFV
jgi:hypothetical protein